MRILSLDLAWTGKTGWCLWDTDSTDIPFQAYGEFKPKRPNKNLPHARKVSYVAYQIHNETLNLIRDWHPDVLVYERTDWHRGPGRVNQAIERRNREALARAETIVILIADKEGVSVMDLGATEAKREFGAKRKDAVAHLLAEEYPLHFEFSPDGDDSYLVDCVTGKRISHHISDAMALAKVAAARLHREEMIEHSQ